MEIGAKQGHSRREFLAAGLAASQAFAAPPDLAGLTLAEAADSVRRRRASPVELVQACLDRIQKYNSTLNAFITVTADQALKEAREMETDQKRGRWRGPLHGVPVGLKDNIDTAGIRTTGASELFRNRVPAEDAEVAVRLKRAGAILLGKLNLVEFAYGGNSAATAYGTVHNPWALDYSPGGSSSGPAAAVAASLCYGALGTDTAGSIRGPASNCGIVGLKPTYGRVSTRGIIPLSWTLDHAGPLCRSVEDAALLLSAIAGYDARDPASVNVPAPDYMREMRMSLSKLRLGRPNGFFDGLDPEVAKAVNEAVDVVRRMCGGIEEVRLPAFGNPAQVWGPEGYTYHAKWVAESPEKYQPGTLRSLQSAQNITASDYIQARREVELLRIDIRKVFSQVDLLVLPTSVRPPGKIGANTPPGRNNNVPFDVFGLPAISVNCGFTRSGLPVGFEIAGAPFAESTVLALAQAYERATEWHRRHPPLSA